MIIDVLENQVVTLPEEDVHFLRERLGGFVLRREHGWAVTRWVGHLHLPSGNVLRIRSPKAPGASVLAWIAYVDPTLRLLGRGTRAVPAGAGEGDIGALAARLFVDELLRVAAAHGLRRVYAARRLRTKHVRGSIDFPALARQGGELSRLPCIVWERLPQTPLNALLASALERIRRDPCMLAAAGASFRRADRVMIGVIPRVDPNLLSGRTTLARSETAFASACALARLIVRAGKLGEGNETSGPAFLINLEALFERTVVGALREYGLQVVAKQPVRYTRVDYSDDGPISSTAVMEIDAFCPSVGGHSLIVDAKYKTDVSAANLQQMVTYCVLKGTQRAVLALPAGHASPHREHVFTTATGQIRVAALPLHTSATSVEGWRHEAREFASRIAQWIAGS